MMARRSNPVPTRKGVPDPLLAQARLARALTLHRQGQLQQARDGYEAILAACPTHFDALHLLGVLTLQSGDAAHAVALIERALAAAPRSAEARFALANALAQSGRQTDALHHYDEALAIKPDYAKAWYNRGIVLAQCGQIASAIQSYDRAIRDQPDFAEAYGNRGVLQKAGGQLQAAIASYDEAIRLKPTYFEAHCNRGIALAALKDMTGAVASYDRALALRPGAAEVHANRGAVLAESKQLDAALESYARTLHLQPDIDFVLGTFLHTKMRLCDWTDHAAACEQLASRIEQGKRAAPALPVLALFDSPALQRTAATTWFDAMHPHCEGLGPIAARAPRDKIRLGYYSADFHEHATAHLMAGVFEHHDRSRFDCIAFSFGPDREDDMRARLVAAFDRFIDVRHLSDRDVAKLSRDLAIDIAIDLKGFTQDMRMGIFVERCAPIQAQYLGYAGTLGAPCIDYLIADPVLIPAAARSHYAEKIVYLPHTYQANDDQKQIANRAYTRQELGLPATGFVFCCFNNNYKITPAVFTLWMRLLQRIDGSVLWLLEDNPTAVRHLRQEAATRGIDPARLVFAPRMALADHLARHRLADLFLDTWPFNAHTTASDALWAGCPVLTCMGTAFASRVAGSLLHAIGLPELVTDTAADYEAAALALASEPERLADLRKRLAANKRTTPLFATGAFTRGIESAYREMLRRHDAGLAPDDIHVAACAASIASTASTPSTAPDA